MPCTFTIGTKEYDLPAPEAKITLTHFWNVFNSQLQGTLDYYHSLQQIKTEHWYNYMFIAPADWAYSARMPDAHEWDMPQELLFQSIKLINAGYCSFAAINMQRASAMAKQLQNRLNVYADRNQRGLQASITVLTFIKEGSETIESAYLGPLGGTAYSMVLEEAQQFSEMAFGLRDHIDMGGIITDAIANFIFSKLIAGNEELKIKWNQKITFSMLSKELTRRITRKEGKEILVGLLKDVGSNLAVSEIDDLEAVIFGEQPDLTLQDFGKHLVECIKPGKLFWGIIGAYGDSSMPKKK